MTDSNASDERRADLLGQLRHLEVEIARIRATLAIAPETAEVDLPRSFAMLVFEAGSSRFGIRTDQIREVIRLVRLEPITDAPKAVLGAMNFRGTRVAVVDMCLRLTGRRANYSLDTPIIVAQRSAGLIGLLVDAVATVEPAEKSQLRPPPNDLRHHAALLGSIEREGRFVHLLDAGLLLAGDEGRSLAEAIQASDAGGSSHDDGAHLAEELLGASAGSEEPSDAPKAADAPDAPEATKATKATKAVKKGKAKS